MRVMGRTSDARERIVAAAADLFHARSFEDVSTAEVCALAGVHPGSLYHFFPTKQELGLAVLEHQWQRMREAVLAPLSAARGAPLERVRGFLDAAVAFHREASDVEGTVRGCPVGNLAVELGTLSPELRARSAAIFQEWAEAVTAVLEEAAARGELREGLAPGAGGLLVVSQVEGALVLAKALDDPAPLRVVADALLSALSRPDAPLRAAVGTRAR